MYIFKGKLKTFDIYKSDMIKFKFKTGDFILELLNNGC